MWLVFDVVGILSGSWQNTAYSVIEGITGEDL
jgi:hypothetical protein